MARAHDCEVVFETGPAGTVAVVAGYDTDLTVTALLYESLHTQAATQMAARAPLDAGRDPALAPLVPARLRGEGG